MDTNNAIDKHTIEEVKKTLRNYALPISNHFPTYHLIYIEKALDDLLRDKAS